MRRPLLCVAKPTTSTRHTRGASSVERVTNDDTKPKEVVAMLSKLQDNYLKIAGKLGLLPTTRLSLSAQAQPYAAGGISPKEKFPDIPGLQ